MNYTDWYLCSGKWAHCDNGQKICTIDPKTFELYKKRLLSYSRNIAWDKALKGVFWVDGQKWQVAE